MNHLGFRTDTHRTSEIGALVDITAALRLIASILERQVISRAFFFISFILSKPCYKSRIQLYHVFTRITSSSFPCQSGLMITYTFKTVLNVIGRRGHAYFFGRLMPRLFTVQCKAPVEWQMWSALPLLNEQIPDMSWSIGNPSTCNSCWQRENNFPPVSAKHDQLQIHLMPL